MTSGAYPTDWLSPEVLDWFNERTHSRRYEKLGAHGTNSDGRVRSHFALWALNAERVSVTGDFNRNARDYGGSRDGNLGGVEAPPLPWRGRPWHITIALPPLAAIFFKTTTRERRTVK